MLTFARIPAGQVKACRLKAFHELAGYLLPSSAKAGMDSPASLSSLPIKRDFWADGVEQGSRVAVSRHRHYVHVHVVESGRAVYAAANSEEVRPNGRYA